MFGYILREQKDISIFSEKILSVSSLPVYLSNPQNCNWKSTKFVFFNCDPRFSILESCLNQFKMLLEMCIVYNVQTKRIFTFHPKTFLFFTSVKSANVVLAWLIFSLSAKKRQNWFLVVMVHIVLQKSQIATTKKKNYIHIYGNLTANRGQTHPKKKKNDSLFSIIISNPHWLIYLTRIHSHSHFIHLQSTVKQHNSSQSPTTVMSGPFFFWTRLS